MCSTNSNETKLFAKAVPVSVTNAFTTNFKSLYLCIEWIQTSTVIAKKELLITITDTNDPFFLYNLQLSEDDYQRLRSTQNLLADFFDFPQKVINYVEQCIQEANKPQPNYLLHITMGEIIGSMASTARLDIEQVADLRRVSHLSLKFLAATESTVRQHLTDCFKNVKSEKEKLQQQLFNLEKDFRERFSACESALERKTQELENVKRDLNEEITKRETKYTGILQEEREKFLSKQVEGESRLESERINREKKLKNEILELERKVSCLETLNKELEKRSVCLEKELNDLRSTCVSTEKELGDKNNELSLANRRIFELDNDLKERNSRINHMMTDIKKMSDNIESKRVELHSVQKNLENSKKEKKKLAKELEETKIKLKDEEDLKTVALSDASKANEIIKKMQRAMQEDHEKCEILKEKYSLQEKSLTEKETIIKITNQELKREKDTNAALCREIQNIPYYENKISELDKKMKETEMVKDQLIKILSTHGITTQYTVPPIYAEENPVYNEPKNVLASGDTNLYRNVNSALPTAQSKAKSSRFSDPYTENSTNPETRQARKSLPANSQVYVANSLQPEIRSAGLTLARNSDHSPSHNFNAKSSTIIASDKNANHSNLEINSNVLSSEFDGLNQSKHSTARKQIKTKGSQIPVKS